MAGAMVRASADRGDDARQSAGGLPLRDSLHHLSLCAVRIHAAFIKGEAQAGKPHVRE
jgi:hypothetical protein